MNPVVSVIMGSATDLAIMDQAKTVLDEFEIPYETRVISAHRTPEEMVAFAKGARARGIKCIIAGAGGAAHLPGMVAALTTLPVIGVPIAATGLKGIDSLYSIVQMPKGVPVATVAIDNATNAAFLAIRMISMYDHTAERYLSLHAEGMKKMVAEMNDNL